MSNFGFKLYGDTTLFGTLGGLNSQEEDELVWSLPPIRQQWRGSFLLVEERTFIEAEELNNSAAGAWTRTGSHVALRSRRG